MANTVLKYFDYPWSYEDKSTLVEIIENKILILDQTIFYPQGGGQPYDQGLIEHGENLFQVNEVRFIDGLVHHIGEIQNGEFKVGDLVTCKINQDRRILHSRLHSAGHLVDYALENLGFNWEPAKGYHFPDGPYVEYKCNKPLENFEPLKLDLEKELNKLINLGAEVSMKIMEKDQLYKICKFVPDYLPLNKPIRAAIFHLKETDGGERGIPCGGTHVQNLNQLGKMTIPKIKLKSGILRISYRCE